MLTLTLTLAAAPSSCDRKTPIAVQQIDGENGLIRLRAEKSSAEDHVIRAKQFADASQRKQAEALYAEARIKYNAYIDGLLHSIREDLRDDLTPSANEASAAATAFKTFVAENSTTKGGLESLSPVTALLRAAWDLIRVVEEEHVKDRKRYADDLAPEIKWEAWEKLGK